MNSNKEMTILQTTDQNLAIACQYNSYHPQNNKFSRYNNSRTGDKSLNHNNILNQIALLRELFSQLMALGSAFIQPEMSTIL